MTSGRRHLARRTGCTALLALVAPLAACGDDTPSPDDAVTAATSAPTGSTEPDETQSTHSDPPAPTVEPASGPLLELDHSTVRAPAGWELTGGVDFSFAVQANDPAPATVNSVFMANGPDAAHGDLDRMVKSFLESSSTDRRPTRQPDTLLDGQPAYFLKGQVDERRFSYVYGAAYSGINAQLIVDLDRNMPGAQQQAIVDSVLASFEWS